MRRSAAIAVLALTVVLGACSSSSKTASSTSPTTAGSGPAATTATTAAKGGTTFADVCSGKAFATAPTQGQTANFAQAATSLQFAVDHAPSDIKPDLTLLATPLIQYFQILANANGNFATAAQNAQFIQLAQRFSQADYMAAAQRVQTWFASHCS